MKMMRNFEKLFMAFKWFQKKCELYFSFAKQVFSLIIIFISKWLVHWIYCAFPLCLKLRKQYLKWIFRFLVSFLRRKLYIPVNFSKQNGSSTTKYRTLIDRSFIYIFHISYILFHQTNNKIVKEISYYVSAILN